MVIDIPDIDNIGVRLNWNNAMKKATIQLVEYSLFRIPGKNNH